MHQNANGHYGRAMVDDIRLLNSITDADVSFAGAVGVSGSHGGLYPATIASRFGLRAVLFNDAGIGLDEAGIAGVKALAEVGMAAAAVDCMSACIGSADDMIVGGSISFVNAVAKDLGIAPGMTVAEAAKRMEVAEMPSRRLPRRDEARSVQHSPCGRVGVLLVDSASLVTPEDRGKIIVTGSHGGLIGGNPSRALKAKARLAVFNDAGFGKNQIGSSRLPALDQVDVAAVTVSHKTARIGDAASAFESGVISALNAAAKALGIACDMPLDKAILDIVAS